MRADATDDTYVSIMNLLDRVNSNLNDAALAVQEAFAEMERLEDMILDIAPNEDEDDTI